ncbi:hypothetical protein [Streptomyces chartreusis]|uniref:hypothetical protein n=1 Tax=Streptomyces chartreusis TaxID=1969 RepID=UPI0033BA3497
MAHSQENTTRTGWTALLSPDAETERKLRHAGPQAARLVECGHLWDAVVISPLHRGLVALDFLGLPLDAGHGVFADYARHEIIVYVGPGDAADGCAGIPGVRTLTRGSWLLVPCGDTGNWYAAVLSRPRGALPRYVDPAALREALVRVDAEREAPAHC